MRTSILNRTPNKAAVILVSLLSFSAAPIVTQVTFLSDAIAQQNSAARNHAHGAPLVPLTPDPTTQPVDIFSFRDPDTGDKIQVQYQPSKRDTLRKFKPSQVRKMISEGFPARPGLKGIAKEFALDFPAEFVAFTGAMLLSSSIHTNNDPLSMKHFIDQNILDPAAYASFAGFLVGSKSTHAALRAMGKAYDPYRNAPDYRLVTPTLPGSIYGMVQDPKTGDFNLLQTKDRLDHFNTQVVKVPGAPTRAQLRFAPLIGPLGLAVGMSFSNVIHEVIADKDIRACSMARSTPAMPQEQADEICDKAWENWALSKKAADFTPDILAMGSAFFIQAYGVNKVVGWGAQKTGEKLAKAMGTISAKTVTSGAEKIIPLVYRGYRLVTVVGTNHPVGRFAMTVANIAVFMEIVHPITPWFKKPLESVRQGANLASEIRSIRNEIQRAEKNNWEWKPQVVSWCQPTANPRDPYNMKMRLDFGCPESKNPSPSVLLKKHAERQTKWREMILQEAFQAHSNWQDYVGKFATMYANTSKFYEQLVQHVNYQKFHPSAEKDTSSLYQSSPLFGITADGQDFSAKSEAAAVDRARNWLQTYLSSKASSNLKLSRIEELYLPQILRGLKAADPTLDIKAIAPMELSMMNINSLNSSQRIYIEYRVRTALLAKSISTVREVLLGDSEFGIPQRVAPLGSPLFKRLGEKNPFAQIQILLGNPEPLPEGGAFIRGSNDDQNIIEQETKSDFPVSVGKLPIKSMAEYLLVSMVCGPEVDPKFSDAEKIQILKNRTSNGTTFEKSLRLLGLGSAPQAVSQNTPLIAINEYKDEITGLQKQVLPREDRNAIAIEKLQFGLTFRPPRIVDGVPQDLCNMMPSNMAPGFPNFDLLRAQWTINGETFNGILDVVKRKIRTDVVGTSVPPKDKTLAGHDPFGTWWTNHVDRHVDRIVKDLRDRYKTIVMELYLPALLGKQEGALAWSLRQMNLPLKFVGWDVKLGALDSIYSELDLYLGVLARTSKNNSTIVSTGNALKKEFRALGALVSDISYVEKRDNEARIAVEEQRLVIAAEYEALAEAVEKSNTPDSEVRLVNFQALRNIQGLLGEMDSYWGIVRGVQIRGK